MELGVKNTTQTLEIADSRITEYFQRSEGQWHSERRYYTLPEGNTQEIVSHLTIKFLKLGSPELIELAKLHKLQNPETAMICGSLVSWLSQDSVSGKKQSEGSTIFGVRGLILYRDRAFATINPIIAKYRLSDPNTLCLRTEYNGSVFEEEIKQIGHKYRTRQTIISRAGEQKMIGQYLEKRILSNQKKVKRRNFLIGATAITLAEFLAGCETQGDLNIQLLKNTIPAQMVSRFKRELTSQSTLNFKPQENLTELFSLLQSWQRKLLLEEQKSSTEQTKNINIANLVTLGDYWLANAIKQELIQPLNSESLQNWNNLPKKWQELVKRNNQGYADPEGKIWAAPYQWGTTLIAYRVDKFKALGWQPTDWSDLWKEELRHRFSLLNQPREVIGLTLKKLGKSYNAKNLSKVENLKSELVKLNQQVKYYASNNYLQSLIIGDTWLAVGWSNDILPLIKTRKDIAAVIPKSGTALWSNLWVKPAATVETSLTEKWIDFCWETEIAEQMSLITQTTSPIIPGINPTELTSEIKDNSLLLPPEDILEKSDFLYPLADSTIEQYRQLWREIRLFVGMKSG